MVREERLNRSLEFMEGYEDGRRGKSRARNPYNPTKEPKKCGDWQLEWECMFYGEVL